MVGSTRRPTNLLVTHLELVHILSMQVHLLSLSGFQNSMVLVHLLFLVLVSRELQLQAATLHYSSLLVLLLQKDSLLRLQRIQFSTKFLALQARVLPKTSLVLDPLLSARPTLLDLPHTEGSSFLLLLVLQPLQVTPQRNSVEIHQKVLIYTSSTERELPRDADLLQKLSRQLSDYLGNSTIQISTLLHTTVSTEISVSRLDLHSRSGGGLNEDGTGPGIVTTRYLPDYPGNEGPIVLSGKMALVVPMLLSIPLVLSSLLVSELMFLRIMMVLSKSVLVKDSFLQLKLVVHSMTSPLLVLVLIDSIESSDTMVMIEILELQELSQSPPRRERPKKELSQSKVLVDSIKSVEAASDEATTFSEVGSGSLYTMSGLAESVTAAELVAGTQTLVGTAEESFIAQTPEETATITLSGTGFAQRRSRIRWFWNTYSIQYRKSCYWNQSLSQSIWSLQYSVWCLRKQLESQEQQVRFLSILLVLQKQDTSKYSKTLFLLELSHYLENSLTQISITLQHTLDLEILLSVVQLLSSSYQELSPYSDYSLSMELLEKDLYLPKKIQFSSTSTEMLLQERLQFTKTSFLLAFLLSVARRDQRNCELWILWGRQRSWNFRNYYTFQHSSCSSICRLHSTYWQGHIGTLPSRWCCWNQKGLPPYSATGSLFKYDSSDEAYARSTYVGIGQVNFFSAGFTEILRFEEGRTYVVII